jgi:hypothetical protein
MRPKPRIAKHPVGVILFSTERLDHPGSRGMARERLRLMQQLVRRGYRVVLPGANEFSDDAYLHQARKMGVKVLGKSFGRDNWIRDAWSDIGTNRFINLAGRARGGKTPVSLGEGGAVIRLSPTRYLLQQRFVRNHPDLLGMLHRQRIRFTILPDPRQTLRGESIPHIDLVMGMVPHKKILVIDRDYYWSAKNFVDRILQENKLRPVFVPRAEAKYFPANFLVLPDGKLLVHPKARITNATLRDRGVELIEAETDLRHNLREAGGPRCLGRVLGKNTPQN